MPDATIHTLATVLEVRGTVLYQVELSNGKTLPAHLSKALVDSGAAFSPGDRVRIELTPYDFDQARVLCSANSEDGSLPDAEAAEDDT